MCKTLSLILVSAFLASVAFQHALADDWHGHGEHEEHEDHGWHDRGDIHHFGDHDYDHWRRGRWLNEDHDGRHGWWWVVDGSWYYYPSPVYPFPDPYTPPVITVAPSPVATIGAPPAYAYYCKNPVGYYPYVPQCLGHWHRVVTGTTTIVQQQPATVVVQQPASSPAVVVAPQPASVPYVASASAKAGGEREIDEHRLNEYAADLQNIDPTGQQASGRLDELGKKVGEFRQSLYKRNYNAIEVSKNAADLEHRIHEEREHLGAPPPAGMAASPQ